MAHSIRVTWVPLLMYWTFAPEVFNWAPKEFNQKQALVSKPPSYLPLLIWSHVSEDVAAKAVCH